MTRASTFRPDIEGLRGVAVLGVVLFHCGITGISGGFAGVDVFFVLSGYLITGLLVNEIKATDRLNLWQFYARRARRLLPAAALVTVATVLVGAVILAPSELNFAGRAARATSVYLSNMFFAVNAADYFARDVKLNPMLHTWSLAVEEQFYLFWPVLIVAAFRFRRRAPGLLVALLSGVAMASLAASIRLTTASPPFAFYGLPTRAWEFALGGLAVLIPRGSLKASPGVIVGLGWLGLLTILGSFHFISERSAFPGWIALAPVLGTTLALIAGAELPTRGITRVLDTTPMQFFGTMSYSWYLWHWPFLVYAAVLYPAISVPGKVLVALASLGVAAVAHYAVENPVRFQVRLVRSPRLSLGLGGVLMAASLSVAIVSIRFAARLAQTPEMRPITAAVNDIADMNREQCVSLAQTSDVKMCSFGDASSLTTVVLFGDSHAIQWFNPLRRAAELHHWHLATLLKSGCPATEIPINAGCAAWRVGAIRRIDSMRPALVVVASSTGYLMRKDAPVSLADWKRGTTTTLTTLNSLGVPIVAIRDTPQPAFDVPTCLARSVRHAWYPAASCQIDKARAVDTAVFGVEVSAIEGLSDVRFIDLTDQICSGPVCPAVRNGIIVYRDDNHLTGAFAESLRPALEARLFPPPSPSAK